MRTSRAGGRFDLAKVWAARAVELLDALPSETLSDVASTRMSVGGVSLPELLHGGVAQARTASRWSWTAG